MPFISFVLEKNPLGELPTVTGIAIGNHAITHTDSIRKQRKCLGYKILIVLSFGIAVVEVGDSSNLTLLILTIR